MLCSAAAIEPSIRASIRPITVTVLRNPRRQEDGRVTEGRARMTANESDREYLVGSKPQPARWLDVNPALKRAHDFALRVH
jgi:hypothetical protein